MKTIIEEFESALADWCRRQSLLPETGSVLCAVSGGADSLCMLTALHAMGVPVVCAHFDHCLRGEESRRDARFVETVCREKGIPFYTEKGDVFAFAEEQGFGIEEAARLLRYAFLERTALETEARAVATAHTADDNLETMLLHLIRGTGARGLGGIPPRRGNIIRPLLFARREQVEAYLKARGQNWVEDSSNARDDYARNCLRHHVVPVLRQLNARAAEHALEGACLLRQDDACLEDLARDFLKTQGEACLSVSGLLALPRPIAARVLRQAVSAELSRKHINSLFALCESEKPSGQADLPGLRVCREYDRLLFEASELPALPTVELRPGETTYLPEHGLEILCEIVEKTPEIHNSFNTFFFQTDSICGKLSVRQRLTGDRIRFSGRTHSITLKKFFIEQKIPRSRRATIPVLADERGPVAVAGYGISREHAAKAGEKAIKIEIIKRWESKS